MESRTLAATGLVLAVIVAIPAYALLVHSLHVPPPDVLSSDTVAPLTVGELQLSADAYFGQDYMPSIGSDGSPLCVLLDVSITNTGNSSLSQFTVPKTTIYYAGTKALVVTYDLSLLRPDEFLVGPGETVVFHLMNKRGTVFAPELPEGTLLYARVLIVWTDGSTAVLTTPSCDVKYTY